MQANYINKITAEWSSMIENPEPNTTTIHHNSNVILSFRYRQQYCSCFSQFQSKKATNKFSKAINITMAHKRKESGTATET